MAFVNAATQATTLPRSLVKDFLCLLAPVAPHIAEELWQRLGEPVAIAYAAWPHYVEQLVIDEVISIGVQVNGKLRAVIEVAADASEQVLEASARNHASVMKALADQPISRVIVVPGRLVNFLTGH